MVAVNEKRRLIFLFSMIVDIRNPSKPVEAARWWYPGQKKGEGSGVADR